MEALARNPFTDERLKDLVISKFVDSKPTGELNLFSLKEALGVIESLDPYANPVTKPELRAWLLDNGFKEHGSNDPEVKWYRNEQTREKLAIVFYEKRAYAEWDAVEVRTEIQIRSEKRNIKPFTLYAEIKLKYAEVK